MNNEWISVKKQVPELDQRFDAWSRVGRLPDHGAFTGRGWDTESIRAKLYIEGITHWMPLPSGPTKDYKPCPEKQMPGGCQLLNIHCGYPQCEETPLT